MFITIENFYANLEVDKSSAARLIFADWLEEQGDKRADLIRKIEAFKQEEFWKLYGHTSKTLFSASRLKRNRRNDYAIDLVEQILPHIPNPDVALEAYQWLQDLRDSVPLSMPILLTNETLLDEVRECLNSQQFVISTTLNLIATHKFQVEHHDEYTGNYIMDNIISNVNVIEYHSYKRMALPQSWVYWRHPVCRLMEYKFFDAYHIWTHESPYAKIAPLRMKDGKQTRERGREKAAAVPTV